MCVQKKNKILRNKFNEKRGAFGGDEGVLKLIVLKVAQFCEHARPTELYTVNGCIAPQDSR